MTDRALVENQHVEQPLFLNIPDIGNRIGVLDNL